MLTFGLDIETIPNPDMADKMPPPKVKLGNLKDPEKIAEKQNEARAKQLEDMGLNAATGRVLCVGMYNADGQACEMIEKTTDAAERTVLEWAFAILSLEAVRIATWNGKGFDLPFLFKRAAILGVPTNCPPLTVWTRRYDTGIHIDLMKEWDCHQPGAFTSLEFFARTVMCADKKDIDFAQFPALIATEEGRKEISAYCIQDAKIVFDGWRKMQGILF